MPDKGKRAETLTCDAQDVTVGHSEPETKRAVRAVRVEKRLDVTLGAVRTRRLRGDTRNFLFLFTSAP